MKPGSLKLKKFDAHLTSLPCIPGVCSSEEPSFFVTNTEIILEMLKKRTTLENKIKECWEE
ncbi:hypothetical protein NC651_018597 [Populus alba x Populus x berolinensis]|nr:hypothetical protein NC651_018597 [Populus alba x Populus x berolinensis]